MSTALDRAYARACAGYMSDVDQSRQDRQLRRERKPLPADPRLAHYYSRPVQAGYWFPMDEQQPTIWGDKCFVLYDDGTFEEAQWYGKSGFLRMIHTRYGHDWVWLRRDPIMWMRGLCRIETK